MSSTPIVDVPAPPSRRLTPTVKVTLEVGHPPRVGFTSLRAYLNNLTDAELAGLTRKLPDFVTALKELRAESLKRAGVDLLAATDLSQETLRRLNSQAADLEHWRSAVLGSLPTLNFEAAEQRCKDTPWRPRQDLLVLPHQGRLHVPLFLFDTTDKPSANWITLVTTLRTSQHRPSDWDILAWLLRPHRLLDYRAPIAEYAPSPARIRFLAQSATKDGQI
jgi:hypothetical protein